MNGSVKSVYNQFKSIAFWDTRKKKHLIKKYCALQIKI